MINDNNNNKMLVGSKQTLKAIKNNEVKKIFLAEDIDQPLKFKILQAVKNNNIPIEIFASKNELGRVCGIDVSAATAALLK
ncbi:ribosomal L7Ae/L30e/S12e/Gadd45 family protein [Halanaerobium hydrogeniformans]|uniref:Ribosomal protein L7Ae/L30e/S12e/Gadd45 n=1 Tax=Halanaerobium hydrogeniformans TaxID=656519 RepID=E4RJC5_HALHG|nr:ribosomal L7Ae/L30e/S12e/Gadd45 family protein [Halanaerobium hydrogeniformans]ADQ15345.1 ribosomal protein L7Ae/L30e/S12e/Gadd45 [Halanaerobium hydrogeniformans]